jgi:hypothetical protein
MAARHSTATAAMGHNALTRTIRHVVTLADTPKVQTDRPSKS